MAQTHASSSGGVIAIERIKPQQPGRLELASPAIGGDGRIDDRSSAYHDNLSPPLSWTGMPDAETFALIVEDPDAPTPKPFLHWIAWNIPGVRNGLPQGVRQGAEIRELGGMTQGRNDMKGHGWFGPKPPPGHGVHRYHFQLFALDLHLDLAPETPLETLVEVLKGRAIAGAELVGTYERAGDIASPPEHRSFAADQDRGGLDEDDVDRHAPHDEEGVVRRPEGRR